MSTLALLLSPAFPQITFHPLFHFPFFFLPICFPSLLITHSSSPAHHPDPFRSLPPPLISLPSRSPSSRPSHFSLHVFSVASLSRKSLSPSGTLCAPASLPPLIPAVPDSRFRCVAQVPNSRRCKFKAGRSARASCAPTGGGPRGGASGGQRRSP